MEKDKDRRFAVLIDSDNISPKYSKIILDEVSNSGTATYKRIYGDWTNPALTSWKGVLLDNSILPVQQYTYTTGKNATDAAMIIDAMDILYSGNVDGICLVSSDSDFTRLAARLRESGMYVIGMGERKTPPAFRSACNEFKYLDILDKSNSAAAEKEEAPHATPEADAKRETSPSVSHKKMGMAIRTIVEENSDEDGWIFIGDIGNILLKRYPDFDVRDYGYQKLTPFISSFNMFTVEFRKANNPVNPNSTRPYVKIKEPSHSHRPHRSTGPYTRPIL